MVGSIKDRVAIIGMGCTQFGELWDKSRVDLIVDAALEAYKDAGVEQKDIQAAWFGNYYDTTGLTGQALAGRSGYSTSRSPGWKMPVLPPPMP